MDEISASKAQGCLLGLALGDAFGAPYEGGPIERLVWRLIGTTKGKRRYTDDTQMSLNLAQSLIEHQALNLDDVASRFAQSYRWSRGYGPGAAKLLKKVAAGKPWQEANTSIYPQGSFGNGGSMRAPVIGLAFATATSEVRQQAARDSARITHAHELGMQGAEMIAQATASAYHFKDALTLFENASKACRSPEFIERMETARVWLTTSHQATPAELKKELGTGMSAHESCPAAIYVACTFLTKPFKAMLAYIAQCGGDVDTVSAMAGAIWGAVCGIDALPQSLIATLEDATHIQDVALELCSLANKMR